MSVHDKTEGLTAQVLYDFEYQTSDSRWIWMREGEKLTVVKQTNADWWRVLRSGEKEVPFFAPASYLQLINDANPEHLDSGIADVSANETDEKSKDVVIHASTSSSGCNIEELVMDENHFNNVDVENEETSPTNYENPIYANVKFCVSKPPEEVEDTENEVRSIPSSKEVSLFHFFMAISCFNLDSNYLCNYYSWTRQTLLFMQIFHCKLCALVSLPSQTRNKHR